MSLPHDVAVFVDKQLNRNKELMRYFKYSFTCDEMVIPTIIFNSTYRKNATVWDKPHAGLVNLTALEDFYYRDGGIHVQTEEDYERLIHCGKMFAHKFEACKSDKVIDMLDIRSKQYEQKQH